MHDDDISAFITDNPMPAVFEGWRISHEWGTAYVDAQFSTMGYTVHIKRFMDNTQNAFRVRTPEHKKHRDLGIDHQKQRYLEPRGSGEAGFLEIQIVPEGRLSDWALRINSWIVQDVLILRELHTLAPDSSSSSSSSSSSTFRSIPPTRYGGPSLTDFDTVFALIGGNGYGWDPSAEPLEGWYTHRIQTEGFGDPEDTVVAIEGEEEEGEEGEEEAESNEAREAVKKSTAEALRRSIFSRRTQGDIIEERRQRPVLHERHPPQLRHKRSTEVSHEPFVSAPPAVSDAIYNFLDALGINDPNVSKLTEITDYIEALESSRQMHAVMGVLMSETAEREERENRE